MSLSIVAWAAGFAATQLRDSEGTILQLELERNFVLKCSR